MATPATAKTTSPDKKRPFVNLDSLLQRLKTNSVTLRSLASLSVETFGLLEHSSKSLTSALDGIHSAPETLESVLSELSRQSVQELRGLCEKTGKDVLDPIEAFRTHYDQQNSKLSRECQVIQGELLEAKNQVERDRKLYFRAAALLFRAPRALAIKAMNGDNPANAMSRMGIDMGMREG